MIPHPLSLKDYVHFLKPRKKDAHKGDFGHVLIIGGTLGFGGAVRLSGEAALRTGAGLVSIATHPHHASFIQASRPELMCHGINQASDLLPLLERASVLVIGPGLGQSNWSQQLLITTLNITDKPIVIDADALNLLSKQPYQSQAHHLYTPHPGEASRLLHTTTMTIQQDRLNAFNQLTEQYKGIVILKGANTLIGQQNQTTHVCGAGNPGMASAGMGDVLTGIIASLIAQKLPLLDAACLGVLIHALAADQAAKAGQRGLIASDLFLPLYHLVNSK
jgi:ADP-dependent NAD(P)H-hydrate dehydratase / NAD(P)H-hydrate epimerase